MRLAVLGVTVLAAGAVTAAVIGWVRAGDAEIELARLRRDHREAAARLFALEYEAARVASGQSGLIRHDQRLAALAVDLGWTPAEAVALGSAIAGIQRMSDPVGRAISPPDGAVWQLELAQSTREWRPHDEGATAVATAARMARSTLRPGPPRELQQILSARYGDTTVGGALRELRQSARALVRAALPRQPATESDRFADSLAFGSPPSGLTPA